MRATIIRLLLLPSLVAASCLLASALQDSEKSPCVGAIRWDAWYGNGAVNEAVQTSLEPPKYHFRLPWFAQLTGEKKVRINGDSQEVMDREIAYASRAGLNYWAFLHYWDESPSLGIALKRYLATKSKRGVRYCFVEEGARLDKIGTKAWLALIEHFRSSDYQTVLGGRPLLFVYMKPQTLVKADWDELKNQTIASGLPPPYLVLMGWNLKEDAKDMIALGFDAISAYARGGAYSPTQPSYCEQSVLLKKNLWEMWRALNVPCVTLASSGWDTRPRNERPPPWIQGLRVEPLVDPTPFPQQKALIDAVTATPDELAIHLRDALHWTEKNRDINVSNTILIYAWNEHDEGGWIQPTLGPDGQPDEARIEAVRSVLRLNNPPH